MRFSWGIESAAHEREFSLRAPFSSRRFGDKKAKTDKQRIAKEKGGKKNKTEEKKEQKKKKKRKRKKREAN